MSPEEAALVRARALRAARKMGFDQEAEEFAQDIVLKRLEGVGETQSAKQAVIDRIRSRYGRRQSDDPDRPVMIALEYITGLASEGKVELDGFEEIIRGLRGESRALILLHFEWGFTQFEIANLFGVTEGRISQRLEGIQARLRSRMAADSARDKSILRGETTPGGAPALPRAEDGSGLHLETIGLLEGIL